MGPTFAASFGTETIVITATTTIEEAYLTHERSLTEHGVEPVAGVDEVGRGALAGPLAAAAVVLPDLDEIRTDPFWSRVRDSKKILEPERIRLAAGIRERAREVSLALIPSDIIDWVGVGPANRLAMEAAINGLAIPPEIVLLDAFVTDLGTPQVSFMKGDNCSLSIAAASIVAKVARDELMHAYDREYAVFGFGKHKGYGARAHLEALRVHGPCPIHRFCFAPVRIAHEAHRHAGD